MRSLWIDHGASGGKGKNRYAYYKCKRSRVSGTCKNYAVRTAIIEEAVIEHFRDVWLSPPGQKALHKAIKRVSRQRDREKPARLKSLETQLAKLDDQISRGTENLLLVDPSDLPALKGSLAGWRDDRDKVQAALEAERVEAADSPELPTRSWPNWTTSKST